MYLQASLKLLKIELNNYTCQHQTIYQIHKYRTSEVSASECTGLTVF